MNLNLNKRIKGKSMKKIILVIFGFLLTINMNAEDKLDVLDKQSKEFFKAITGLEKDYLEEQITNIKNKKELPANSNPNAPMINAPIETSSKLVTQEEYAKNIFEHENDMARLTTDFTRTKKLKDIKIKSMYTFNGKNYVVLKLDDENAVNAGTNGKEATFNIEGRYTQGDYILTHKIVSVDIRTKTVELYKKFDEEFGYSIYLSSYGISVSDLKKEPKKVEEKETKKPDLKEIFSKVPDPKNETNVIVPKSTDNCLYTVNKNNLNVRVSNDLNARVLRILKKDDQFIVKDRKNNWFLIDTIYKKVSGDTMIMDKEPNWVLSTENSLVSNNKNCL